MFEDDEVQEHVAVNLDDDDVSDEDVLLFSTFTGNRIFVLNNAHMTNIVGLLLEESDDSFLVGLPAKMIENDAGYQVQPFAPVPYMRLLKSATMTVMYTFGAIEAMYSDYLRTKGREMYPEVAEYIDGGEAEVQSVQSEAIAPDNVEVSLTVEETAENKVQGMTDEELREYLTNKYKNGELASGSRKKQ
jgi:hypothetical protein